VFIAKDPSDDIFLQCALTGGAKCIISGDRHLLDQKTFKRIKIVTPAEFLSSLLA
jgi:predicted nucleic acid-binding protein